MPVTIEKLLQEKIYSETQFLKRNNEKNQSKLMTNYDSLKMITHKQTSSPNVYPNTIFGGWGGGLS